MPVLIKKSLAQRLFAKLRILFFYRKGGKLSLVSLYEQRFPRYRPIFKIAIFRHETWNVEKMPGVAYVSFLYPRMSKLSLFSLYWQRFMRYRLIFGVTPFGYGTRNLKKKNKKKTVPEVAPSFYTPRVKIFAADSGFRDRADFKKMHMCA